MRKLPLFIVLVFICIIGFFTYIGRWRISVSNYYAKGFINTHIFSGNSLIISIALFESESGTGISLPNMNRHHFIETIIFPVKNKNFIIHMSGGYMFPFFIVYDFFGYQEYKLANIPISTGMGGDFPINIHEKFKFGGDCFEEIKGSCLLSSLFRNSIFDQGGTIKAIIMQIATPLSGNIVITKTQE